MVNQDLYPLTSALSVSREHTKVFNLLPYLNCGPLSINRELHLSSIKNKTKIARISTSISRFKVEVRIIRIRELSDSLH